MTNRFFQVTTPRGTAKIITEIDLARVGHVEYHNPNRIAINVLGAILHLETSADEFIEAWKSYLEG